MIGRLRSDGSTTTSLRLDRDRRRRELARESAECSVETAPIPTADAILARGTYFIEENRLLREFEPMDVNIYLFARDSRRPPRR